MEPDDLQTLRLVENRIMLKATSFSTWEDFIAWIVEKPDEAKAFILQCLDDVIALGDAREAKLLLTKSLIKG